MHYLLRDLVVLSYISAALFVDSRAGRYLKQPRPLAGIRILDPTLFTDGGQKARLTAVRFYVFGTVALIAVMWLLSR